MSACDECWNRAYIIARRTGRHQAEAYRELIATNPEHDGDADPAYTPSGLDEFHPDTTHNPNPEVP